MYIYGRSIIQSELPTLGSFVTHRTQDKDVLQRTDGQIFWGFHFVTVCSSFFFLFLFTYRIERRVEVAQPEEERCSCWMNLTILAQAHCEGHDKEGQPTDDKGAGDDGQCLCCFTFTFRLQQLAPFGQLLVWIGNASQHTPANGCANGTCTIRSSPLCCRWLAAHGDGLC